MGKSARFFVFNSIVIVLLSAVFDGLCTFYLLSKGFSFLTISIHFSISLAGTSILELPSGYLADRIGRKKVFGLGLFFRALQGLLIVTGTTAACLYLAGITEAVFASFTSGSLEAWLKGTEQSDGPPHNYAKIFGSCKTASSVVSIITLFLVGAFYQLDLSLLYLIVIVLYVIAAVVCFCCLPDNRSAQKGTLSHDAAQIIRLYLSSRALQYLTLILSLSFTFVSVYLLFMQPRAAELGLKDSHLLFMSAIKLLGCILAGMLCTRWVKNTVQRGFVLFAFCMVLLSFAGLVFAPNLVVFAAANLIYGLGMGLVTPMFFSWSLGLLTDNYTASLISLMNAIASVIAAITTVLVGYVIDQWGLNASMYLGILLVCASIAALCFISNTSLRQKDS